MQQKLTLFAKILDHLRHLFRNWCYQSQDVCQVFVQKKNEEKKFFRLAKNLKDEQTGPREFDLLSISL